MQSIFEVLTMEATISILLFVVQAASCAHFSLIALQTCCSGLYELGGCAWECHLSYLQQSFGRDGFLMETALPHESRIGLVEIEEFVWVDAICAARCAMICINRQVL